MTNVSSVWRNYYEADFVHWMLQIVAEGTIDEIFSQVEKFLDKK